MDVRGKRLVVDAPLSEDWEEMSRRLEELGAEVVPTPSGPGDVAFARFGDAFEGVPVLPAAELVDAVVSGGGHDVAVPEWFGEERERLEALERERGVTDEHRAATARLREHGARLRHPYVNVEATFKDYALSPCKRWLATARWDMAEDSGTLGAALVIAAEEHRDDLDSVLAWVVGRRFAWPARWGDAVGDREGHPGNRCQPEEARWGRRAGTRRSTSVVSGFRRTAPPARHRRLAGCRWR